MKKFFINILTALLFVFPVLTAAPSYAVMNNGVWNNDLKNLFLKNQAIILAINIRSFNAVDKNKNDIIETDKGDIAGNFVNAAKRLNEISSYGVNTLHLLPITPVGKIKAIGTAGSLYAISDFTRLNPQLDDPTNDLSVEEEARNFIKEYSLRVLTVSLLSPLIGLM